LRSAFFSFLGKVADTDDARGLVTHSLNGLVDGRPGTLLDSKAAGEVPYADLGIASSAAPPSTRTDVIFISARFRTGSTLLWNLFRNIDGVTAYYEPLNERRWFDPSLRGDRLDPTHRQVSDYWKEYEGLQELGQYYQEAWNSRNLFMGPTFWEPNLKRYIELLIDRAGDRPVLQFNRVDFRLPWLRQSFPGARIVHLYRHPRDQWCSSLMGDSFPLDGDVASFARQDRFYLLSWARDLAFHFPFLDEKASSHPYQLFYYIWKLSYVFGRSHAHYSLAYERLLEEPADQLRKLLSVCNVPSFDEGKLVGLLEKPSRGKWRRYADDDWFRRHEENCERVLRDFFAQELSRGNNGHGP
jgi:hypothetical protein